jgi:hypothetical protein
LPLTEQPAADLDDTRTALRTVIEMMDWLLLQFKPRLDPTDVRVMRNRLSMARALASDDPDRDA